MISIGEALKCIEEKKKKLDAARPLPPELEKNLQEWLTINFIYETNALEGNSLSHTETAIVIEKGIAIGGKTLEEHIELINCARAMKFIMRRSHDKTQISVEDIRTLYKYSSEKIDPSFDLIVFTQWLSSVTDHPVIIAALAHYKLMKDNSFKKNGLPFEALAKEGRTARLLMNLLLLQQGYPLAIIQKEQRSAYIDAIEHARETDNFNQFYAVIIAAVEYSLDIYLDAIKESNL